MISRIIKVSVSVISLGHKHHTLTLIFLDIAIPQVRESETILDSELRAVDSAFQLLVGFRSPKPSKTSWTPESGIGIPLHRAIIGIMVIFTVVQDVDLNYQHSASLIVHGCCSVVTPFTPLSPNSDKDQFSPDNIHTLSRDKL